jgi:hypothetical protein
MLLVSQMNRGREHMGADPNRRDEGVGADKSAKDSLIVAKEELRHCSAESNGPCQGFSAKGVKEHVQGVEARMRRGIPRRIRAYLRSIVKLKVASGVRGSARDPLPDVPIGLDQGCDHSESLEGEAGPAWWFRRPIGKRGRVG